MSVINEKQKEDLRESLKEAKDALEFIALADPLFYSELKNSLFPCNELRIGDLVFKDSGNGLVFGMVAERNDKREFNIKDVIFNDPATIVMWSDGSKTVVKCQLGDTYSEELGLAMCIAKKYYGNTGAYNEVFKRFIPKESKKSGVIYPNDLGAIEFEITLDPDSVEKLRGLGQIKEG